MNNVQLLQETISLAYVQRECLEEPAALSEEPIQPGEAPQASGSWKTDDNSESVGPRRCFSDTSKRSRLKYSEVVRCKSWGKK